MAVVPVEPLAATRSPGLAATWATFDVAGFDTREHRASAPFVGVGRVALTSGYTFGPLSATAASRGLM
jgi:hypothetical protein